MKLTLLSALVVLVSCGGSSNPNSAPSISAEELAAARSNFETTIESLAEPALSGGAGISNGAIFGVSANSDKGVISIWNWDGSQFVFGTDLILIDDWCGDECTWGIDSIQLVDLTGEGDDDIYTGYHLNDPEGQVFSQVSGSWKSLNFDLGLHASEIVGTSITAYHEPCLPSCADGGAIPISYSWNGSEFTGSAVDDFGNRFSLVIGPACTKFNPNDYEPYKLCDKGDGIHYLQQVLNDYGLLYSTSSNPVDGFFGAETEYSIKVYQFQNHLPVDGLVEGQWYHDLIETYNLMNGMGD